MAVKKILLKLIIVVVVVIGLFVLYVGYKSYKAGQDFKPYQLLAVELNNELGGGFTISEKKPGSCQLNEASCPSIKIQKTGLEKDLEKAKSLNSKLKSDLIRKGYTITNDTDCVLKQDGLQFCGALALNAKDNTNVLYSFGSEKISLDIYKP